MGSFKDLLPIIAIVIPILAILGGIIIGIIRALGEQRIIELAQRERIAAIERGIDPSKLPPLPASSFYEGYAIGRPPAALRRAQGLLIGGLVTLAVGIGLLILFIAIEPREAHWVGTLIPILVGLALLLSARIVWPRANGTPPAPPTAAP